MKKISSVTDTQDLSLTIYNGGFGAVREKRAVNLTGAETELVFGDVAKKIETDSLLVEGLNVLEFNYDYDLVDRGKLLGKYIDKEVYLIDRKTHEKKSCRLLSVEGSERCVLEDNESKEIYIDPHTELVLPSLPAGLIVKPALVWKIAPTTTENIKVSYLSNGFSWNVNYVVELLEKTLNIAGWAEIENQSGTTFENARIKLMAGDVNRIVGETYYILEEPMLLRNKHKKTSMEQVEEKSFVDYHMYTLFNPTTLKDNQTKQINILNGVDVPYKRYYQLDKGENKASIIIEFANKKESRLGIAMPKGKIKLYQADEGDNSLEFIGEDSIEHTPKDEDIQLNIGNAFDITFEYKNVEQRKRNGFEYYKFECTIKNHKEVDAEVHFDHYIWGVWEMVSTSHDYITKTSRQVQFVVNALADSETKVAFQYKVDRRTEVIIKKE